MADWKSVLNDYICHTNRMEVTRSMDSLRAYVLDDNYLRIQADRLDRLSARDESLQRRIQRCETRARIIEMNVQPRQTAARIRISKRWTDGSGRKQEQVEHERVTMVFRRGEWVISRIDVDLAEKSVPQMSLIESERQRQSEPYINRDLLFRRYDTNRIIKYNREQARQYADNWWNSANPQYHLFSVDCTNFVSQCLFAGGIPMNYTGRRESGWWYEGYKNGRERWSYSWAVAHSLQVYMLSSHTGLRAQKADSASQLAIGDIISYDWDGDAKYQHTAIVTAFDHTGAPLVNAHTNDSRHRFWDYRDSYAWSERTRYTFLHIPDTL